MTGPTHFAEVQLTDGQMHLAGSGSFDMGVFADTVRLHSTANLQITNASLGEFGIGAGTTGLIEANDSSSCTITNSRTAIVRLKTTNAAAAITAQNLFGTQSLILDNSAGGTITVTQATPTQYWDLQNLGFESALLGGGVPPYWSPQSVTGSLVADPAPGTGGANSYALVAQAANASLQKQLTLPAETFVSVIGAAKVVQAPGGGAQLLLQSINGATTVTKAANLLLLNTWQRVQVPLLTVGAGASPTVVKFVASGLPATVRLDDIRVQIGSWWDDDNLGNLGFELECRHPGQKPNYWTAPDAWLTYQASCVPDAGILRPGAAPGSRSVRTTLQGSYGNVYKQLTFLRTGETAVVRGWVRGVSANPGANMQAIVGNGPTFYVPGFGPNQHSGAIACDGIWRQFQLTYVVPSNPSYTRIDLGLFDVSGTQCWFDDITVDIQ